MRSHSRRAFLLDAALAAGGLAALLSGCGGSHDPGPLTPEAKALAGTRQAAAEAAQIGEAWLKAGDNKATFARLVKGAVGDAPPADAAALKALVAERHKADLEGNRLILVNGWVLSSTEVHLYGLVALSRRQRA